MELTIFDVWADAPGARRDVHTAMRMRMRASRSRACNAAATGAQRVTSGVGGAEGDV